MNSEKIETESRFPHASHMLQPSLLPGQTAQSLADARWKWAGHESGLQSAPGARPTSVEPWTSWDIMGPYLGGAPKIAKLIYNSNFTRTDGRYIYD